MSEASGVSLHTLRYYEKEGLLTAVERGANGYRKYSAADMEWLEFLMRLRAMGMPISRMKRYSELRSQGDGTIAERRRMLELHRQESLEGLNRSDNFFR